MLTGRRYRVLFDKISSALTHKKVVYPSRDGVCLHESKPQEVRRKQRRAFKWTADECGLAKQADTAIRPAHQQVTRQ